MNVGRVLISFTVTLEDGVRKTLSPNQSITFYERQRRLEQRYVNTRTRLFFFFIFAVCRSVLKVITFYRLHHVHCAVYCKA
jgi:hypothetical protein